jgi:L-lactate dehydrogenase (cytochrome)
MEGDRAKASGWGQGGLSGRAAELRRRYPTFRELQERAEERTPSFAYWFAAGGCGDGAPNHEHNRAAMDAVRIVPRYGVDVARVDTTAVLFGRRYAMPVGVAPMGNIGMIWPDMDAILAAAAQKARIPYVSSTVANVGMERLATLAPDVFWYQLYGVPREDHAVSFDLVRRAQAVGAQGLMLTLDVPARQKRVHDIRNGLVVPFKFRPDVVREIVTHPLWALRTLMHGQPRFPNLAKYVGERPNAQRIAAFTQAYMTSGLTWEVIARIRDIWQGPLVVKGIQHPDDAEMAVQLGCDGILVSNHGGRQFDAAPASIDTLPAVAAQVAGRATVMLDSSVRSGLDVTRALACGADFCFAGRAFLWAVAALGEEGGDHQTAAFLEEVRGTFAQSGVRTVEQAKAATVLHPNAIWLERGAN